MKKCPKCSKEYQYGNYCAICGSRLVEEVSVDIFGDPLYESEPKEERHTTTNEITITNPDNIRETPNIVGISKFLSLISLGTFFVPMFGIVISIAALALSIVSVQKSDSKKQIAYFIISLTTLILSIIFFVLLLKSGVLSDLISVTE